MMTKFFALLIVCAFALNGIGAATAFPLPDTNKKDGQANQLAALLPASDGAMTLNVQKALSVALPQILSGNQQMIADILGEIDKIKVKTGIDLRQFEQITVGVSSKKNAARELEFEPVVLARGTFNANALIAAIKPVIKATYREEKIGDRTVSVFTAKETVKKTQNPSAKPPSAFEKSLDKMFDNLSREFAVTTFDDKTLVIGSLARVRETFAATVPRIGGDVLDLISRKPDSLASFALKLPEGISDFIQLGNDEFGKNLDAIRFLAGSLDVADGNAAVSLTAKTAQAEQAQSLQEQLDGLKGLGKILIGGMKGADKQIFSRMLDNVKIGRNLSEITIDLQVPQSDINTLLNKKTVQKTEASFSK